jgi:folate-binding protein YgfZ
MHQSEDPQFEGEMETDVAAFVDPRSYMMGVRVLCAEGSLELNDPSFQPQNDNLEYTLMRLMLGIPESSNEIGNQFPLNMLLHYINGVSFSKGCYIGQELTQRTFHTGVVRRILLPFLIMSKDDKLPKVNSSNFIPIQNVDKNFDIDIVGELITAQKTVKKGDTEKKS